MLDEPLCDDLCCDLGRLRSPDTLPRTPAQCSIQRGARRAHLKAIKERAGSNSTGARSFRQS
jgi:hypothetical protein